jgi:hypothetical protein
MCVEYIVFCLADMVEKQVFLGGKKKTHVAGKGFDQGGLGSQNVL